MFPTSHFPTFFPFAMLNRRNFIKSAILTAAGSLSAVTVFAFQSTELEITHEQMNVSGASKNLRLVAVSDIHGRSEYLPPKDLVNVINSLRPDVFILAGDIVDRRRDLGLIEAYKSVIVRYAKVAVMGNWEHRVNHNAEKLEKRYRDIGARLLINDVYGIEGYHFTGIDDYLYQRFSSK
jgi:predicted MPP superfamily phosphohydrolase